MLNMEPISESVGDDVGMISGVDPQSITNVVPIGDAPSVMSEFMAEDDAAFGMSGSRIRPTIVQCQS
jgi:hypothetical protein